MTIFNRLVLSIIITLIGFGVVVFFAGGGHGTFVPMKLLFPYSMIVSVMNQNINWLAIIIGVIQFPIYAFAFDKKIKWRIIVLILHIFAVIIAFKIDTQIFNS